MCLLKEPQLATVDAELRRRARALGITIRRKHSQYRIANHTWAHTTSAIGVLRIVEAYEAPIYTPPEEEPCPNTTPPHAKRSTESGTP